MISNSLQRLLKSILHCGKKVDFVWNKLIVGKGGELVVVSFCTKNIFVDRRYRVLFTMNRSIS